MAYIEKSTEWILKRMIFNGFKTISKGLNLFYSIITLFLILSSIISLLLIDFLGLLTIQIYLIVQLSVLITFLINSLIFLKIKKSSIRILISIISIILVSFILIVFVVLNIV